MKAAVTGSLHAVEAWISENPRMSVVIGLIALGKVNPDAIRTVTEWANKIVAVAGWLVL